MAPLAAVAVALITLAGCSDAIRQRGVEPTDVSSIEVGATRQTIETVLGQPVDSVTSNIGRIDTYTYDMGAAGDRPRYTMADPGTPARITPLGFYLLVIWPVIDAAMLVPTEMARYADRLERQKGYLEIIYRPDDTARHVVYGRAGLETRELLKELRALAACVDIFALYGLGHLRRNGLWVEQDRIRAYMWYRLAASYGHHDAAEAKAELASELTLQDVAEADKLADQWRRSDCDSYVSASPPPAGLSYLFPDALFPYRACRAYDGQELPQDEIAILDWSGCFRCIRSIDSARTCPTSDVRYRDSVYDRAELLPGEHTLDVSWYVREAAHLQSPLSPAKLDMKPGHTYRILRSGSEMWIEDQATGEVVAGRPPPMPSPATDETVRWISLCQRAEDGSGPARSDIAFHFRFGWPVERDRVEAYKWYGLAVQAGYSEAATFREELSADMTAEEIARAERLVSAWKPGDCEAMLRHVGRAAPDIVENQPGKRGETGTSSH